MGPSAVQVYIAEIAPAKCARAVPCGRVTTQRSAAAHWLAADSVCEPWRMAWHHRYRGALGSLNQFGIVMGIAFVCATTTTAPHHRNHHHSTSPRQHTITPPHHHLVTTPPLTTAAAAMVCCGGNALDSFRPPAVTRTDCGCTVPAQPMRAAATRSRTCRTETRAAEARSALRLSIRLHCLQCSAVRLVRNNVQRATLRAGSTSMYNGPHATRTIADPRACRFAPTSGGKDQGQRLAFHSVMNRELSLS